MTQEARCIKAYAEDDSLQAFEAGIISEDEIEWNNVGDIAKVVVAHYDKNYWELINKD